MDVNSLKVGTYVRTKYQGIKRIDTIFEEKTVNKYGYETGSEWDGKIYSYIKTTDVLDFAHNPKRLIVAGDYINGQLIGPIENGIECYGLDEGRCYFEKWLETLEVESIVTKEQFASLEYRLPKE